MLEKRIDACQISPFRPKIARMHVPHADPFEFHAWSLI